jgi:EAL domain-containing protein (putative c-di-GMP-specific phosphodiesterase class I)
MRSSGIVISIDDFGTGYRASLSARLPLTSSRSTGPSCDITTDDNDAAIVRATIGLPRASASKSLPRRGRREPARLPQRYGCDYGQGYLFGKPAVPEAFIELVRRQPLT